MTFVCCFINFFIFGMFFPLGSIVLMHWLIQKKFQALDRGLWLPRGTTNVVLMVPCSWRPSVWASTFMWVSPHSWRVACVAFIVPWLHSRIVYKLSLCFRKPWRDFQRFNSADLHDRMYSPRLWKPVNWKLMF